SVPALAGIDHQKNDKIDRQEDSHCLYEELVSASSRLKPTNKGKDKHREVKQKSRVEQVADGLTGQSGTVGIITGEQPEAGVQTAAMLTCVDQSDIESREPAS